MESENKKKQLVTKAQSNVNKLEKLISELLDVSKIQSGQLELSIQQFDIDALLSETITSMQIVSPLHALVKDGNGGPVIIAADRQRIEQVLINLISNAVKYSPAGKTVVINFTKNEKEVVVAVKDFGIGIPENERENIFERLYRARDISPHVSGFGLGLYICRDIIKRHKGKIWIGESTEGTEFLFSIPLKIVN